MTDDDTKDQTTDERLGLIQSELREVRAKLSALEAEAEERTRETRLNLEKILKEIFDSERLKLEEESDQRLTALINAQVKYEVRQEWLEEAFRQVVESHHLIVNLVSVHGDRLDGQGMANAQAESRLDALIEAQTQLFQHVDALTGAVATLNGRIDRIGAHLEKAAEQIITLATAQTRAEEQIKALLERDSTKKTTRTSARLVKKGATP